MRELTKTLSAPLNYCNPVIWSHFTTERWPHFETGNLVMCLGYYMYFYFSTKLFCVWTTEIILSWREPIPGTALVRNVEHSSVEVTPSTSECD